MFWFLFVCVHSALNSVFWESPQVSSQRTPSSFFLSFFTAVWHSIVWILLVISAFPHIPLNEALTSVCCRPPFQVCLWDQPLWKAVIASPSEQRAGMLSVCCKDPVSPTSGFIFCAVIACAGVHWHSWLCSGGTETQETNAKKCILCYYVCSK